MMHTKGFTLMELMIVIAIILIIAAIAVPGMIQSKMHADEVSAVASIRAIQNAELSYETTYPDRGYANSLANLGGPDPCTRSADTACLLDQSLAGGTKSGYNFIAIGGNPANGANTTYVVGAAPVAYDRTGIHRFCSTEKHVIREDANTEGSTTPPDAEQCAGFKAIP